MILLGEVDITKNVWPSMSYYGDATGVGPHKVCWSGSNSCIVKMPNGNLYHGSRSIIMATQASDTRREPRKFLPHWIYRIQVHLYFLSLCKIDTAQVAEILPHGRQGAIYLVASISLLLNQQQPWYWLVIANYTDFNTRAPFTNMGQL